MGNQFRHAIEQYYEKTPGALKKYPDTLNDLLKDKRQISTQRYLRKIYMDPMTRSYKWGIVEAPQGGIMGVYSRSAEHPFKMENFSEVDQNLAGKTKYSEWQFVYLPVINPKQSP